jgi:RHS repeat-associated protein
VPGTTMRIYYAESGAPSVCSNADYAGFVCEILPASQTTGSEAPPLMIKQFVRYDALGDALETVESPEGETANVRRVVDTFDPAGRQTSTRVEGAGVSLPKTETLYSASQGFAEKQQTVCEGAQCAQSFKYEESLVSSGVGNGSLEHPSDVVFNQGMLFVLDQGSGRVEELNASGEVVRTFGSKGYGEGQLYKPEGIAVSGNLVWITDSGSARLEEFNRAGEFVRSVGGLFGSKNGQFESPDGIAIDNDDDVWVCDTKNGRIQEFSINGSFMKVVNPAGLGAIEPAGINIDGEGHVWVADRAHDRLVEFNEAGALIGEAGESGTGHGQFREPGAVSVDPEGRLWVLDEGNDRVEELNQAGEYVAEFGTEGSAAGQFDFGASSAPVGITSDEHAHIWVTDPSDNRVERFFVEGEDRAATTVRYNSLGQVEEYEDADGNVTHDSYDVDGRPTVVSDDKGTQTFSYDPVTGRMVRLEDSGAGTFTAVYDADGNLVERTLPNGLSAKTGYNAADEAVSLTYAKTAGCTSKCTWYDEAVQRSISGQILIDNRTDPTSSTTYAYAYDSAGRLSESRETPAGGNCVSRLYRYDEDSDRTEKIERTGLGSACSTTGGSSEAYNYDAADRLTGSGVTYDPWGRITKLPALYAGGKELLTEYFSSNMVADQSQGGITNTYELDASGRRRQRVQAGGVAGVEVFHYDTPGGSPSWTALGATWTRNVTGISGELAAVQKSNGSVTFDLTDLHGDAVEETSADPNASGPIETLRYDEFGERVSGAEGSVGWLGGKQVRTELASGVIQMGARVYVPQIGRFLTPDPEPGGSANAYDYANQDPINMFDVSGTHPNHALGNAIWLGPKLKAKATSQWTEGGNHAVVTVSADAYGEVERKIHNAQIHVQIMEGHTNVVSGDEFVTEDFHMTPSSTSSCGAEGYCATSVTQSVTFSGPCDQISEVSGFLEVRAWLSGTTNNVQSRTEPIYKPYYFEAEIECEEADE